jgi:hypothetical protein
LIMDSHNKPNSRVRVELLAMSAKLPSKEEMAKRSKATEKVETTSPGGKK